MALPVQKLTFVDQSQIDFGKLFNTVTVRYDSLDIMGRKYEHIDPKFKDQTSSKLHIDLTDLHCLEVINYYSNMINEYSIKLVVQRANSLTHINLTNIESFLNPLLSRKILGALFTSPNIQKHLTKLVLLQNPNLDNSMFGSNFI